MAAARPSTTMFQGGDHNWETNKRSDYRQHELQRQELARARDNLRPLDGKLADETEARRQFDGKAAERTTKARPNTSMLRDGDFDWETNKKADFRSHEVQKQERMKAQDNLKPLEGKLKDKTESKRQYDGKQGDRTQAARPATSMLQEGKFNWNTNKKDDYRHHDGVKKTELHKMQDNLNLLPKGAKLEGQSVARSTYQDHPRSRSAGPEPRQRFQKTNLALPDAPLEGVSETRGNFDAKAIANRSKSLDRPRPEGNLMLNKDSPFAQKQATSAYDYKTAFEAARPDKVSLKRAKRCASYQLDSNPALTVLNNYLSRRQIHLLMNCGRLSSTKLRPDLAVPFFCSALAVAEPGIGFNLFLRLITAPFS